MLVPDLNVIINAETTTSEHYESARRWFDDVANGSEAVSIPEPVFVGFVRITTGAGVKENRISPERAFEVCQALRQVPAFVPIAEGAGHWRLFRETVLRSGISGPDITDAYLAAYAMENDAIFVTFDGGFRRFPGLKLQILT
jgi:toxin-antitoxin system PIN domain toxin